MSDIQGAPPLINEISRPWWDALAREEIQMQCCNGCDRWVFYPRPFCPACGDCSLSWKPVTAEATLYTWTVAEVAVAPAFAHLERPILAVAELANGVKVPTSIVGASPQEIAVGIPLSPVFDHDSYEGVTLLRFRTI